MSKSSRSNGMRDYPTTFIQKCNLVIDLYGLRVKNGELRTAYEPIESHKAFISENKERIVDRLNCARY